MQDAVTHIICNELALSKIHQLIRKKHPPVVVRCDWVMASIAARRQVYINNMGFTNLFMGDVLPGPCYLVYSTFNVFFPV